MASPNKNSMVMVLTVVVIVLVGVVYWQHGAQDCAQRLGPIMQTRFIPITGCEVKMGDTWRSEAEIKNSVNEGAREIQDGTKKVMQGIFGNEKGK